MNDDSTPHYEIGTFEFRRGPHVMPADCPGAMTGRQWDSLWRRAATEQHATTDGLYADAAFSRGVLRMTATRDYAAAAVDFTAALAIDPNMAAAACNLGVIYHAQATAAGAAGDKANADGLLFAANQFLRMAARVRPTDPALWTAIGSIERERGHYDRAETFHKRAIELAPDFPDSYFNLGRLYLMAVNPYTTTQRDRDRIRFGEQSARAFAAYSARRPNDPDGWANQGAAALLIGNIDTARDFFRHALTIDPNNAGALENLGVTLLHAGDYESAIAHLKRSAELKPDNYRARFRLALTMLQYGDFRAGFWEYEIRFHAALSNRKFIPDLPQWNGAPLPAGARLLIWAEQGLGDQILFMSALGDAIRAALPRLGGGGGGGGGGSAITGGGGGGGGSAAGDFAAAITSGLLGAAGQAITAPASIVFLCKDQLAPAAARCFGHIAGVSIVSFDTDKPAPWPDLGATHHAALGSVFGMFRRHLLDFARSVETRRAQWAARRISNAAQAPYLWAKASAALQARHEFEKLKIAAGRRRIVGVSWSSIGPAVGADKSIPAAAFARALADPDSLYVSLQYSPRSDDVATLAGRVAFPQERDHVKNFDAFLADCAACDEIITISNTTAHAAGALGIKASLLLPHDRASLWYWFRERSDSPIYPSLTIYRGDFTENWHESAIDRYLDHAIFGTITSPSQEKESNQ
jgi:Flp pilus assembly protein TadD